MPETRRLHIELTPRFKFKLLVLLLAFFVLQGAVFYLGGLYGMDKGGAMRVEQRALKRKEFDLTGQPC